MASSTTVKKLFATSINLCAFPRCSETIYDKEYDTIVGEIAHIRARKKGGPRFDPSYPIERYHDYENLILLCTKHHKIVDYQPTIFPIESLLEMKKAHEQLGKPVDLPLDSIVERLIEKMHQVIEGSDSRDSEYIERINRLVTMNGVGLKKNDYPLLEIAMVPRVADSKLLEANESNRILISIAPWFVGRVDLTREYYFGDTIDNEDFIVYSNGETYYIYLLILEPKDHYLDNIMREVINNILFIARILKKKDNEIDYVIQIRLLKMTGYDIWVNNVFKDSKYFPPKDINIFDYYFNTGNEWESFKHLFYTIFKDFCTDLGMSRIQDQTIHKRIYKILKGSQFLGTEFITQKVDRIDINDFNYSEVEKK